MPLWADRKTESRATKQLWIQHGAVPIKIPAMTKAVALVRWRIGACRRKIAARKRGTRKRIVATPMAAKPRRRPQAKHRIGEGAVSARTICQTSSQKTKAAPAVGIRIAEYASAGTKKHQPAAARIPVMVAAFVTPFA